MFERVTKHPLFFAISLHLILFLGFGLHASQKSQPLDLNLFLDPQVNIVQAAAVSQKHIDQRLDAINKAEQAKLAAEQQRRAAIEQKRIERLAEQEQQKRAEEQNKQQALLEQQQAEQKRQQQIVLEQQRIAEQKKQDARVEYVQAELSRYAQLILNAISAHWVIDSSFLNRNLQVKFLLNLDLDGNVQSVTLQQSSGYSQLDNAARDAIYAASPLPMSTEQDIYSRLQTISLTMRPEQVSSPNRI